MKKVTGQNKNYHFKFTLSGKDVKGRAITDTTSYRQTFSAKSQEKAEKKLRATYFSSVQVNIVEVTVTQ